MTMKFLWVVFLAGCCLPSVNAEELSVNVKYLGLDHPSPSRTQLWVQVTNEGFTSTPLLDKMKVSQLLVDGRPFRRTDAPFRGPVGLPVKGSWEGCMMLDDYVPGGLAPGVHHIQLQIGEIR